MTGDPGAPPAFAPGIFEGAGAATALIGSHCAASGRFFFPPRATCPDDGAPARTVTLSREGELYSYTIVRIKPPFGLPAPYAVGYVDLTGNALRIFALLDPAAIGDYRIGLRLVLTSGPLGTDLTGAACVRPYFTPDRAGERR